MSDQKVSALLALSLVTAPMALPASVSSGSQIASSATASSHRTAARRMMHQLAVAPMLQPMGTYVGELQEKWQFPSDHLPVGMTFDNFHVLSWNVLDGEFMDWVIEKNSQGLSRSQIAKEHVYIGDSKLTVRDQHVVNLILETIHHPTHPRALLSLQECSEPFLQELRSRLPVHFEMVSQHGDAVVLDQRRFEVIEAKEVPGIFSDNPKRTLQDVCLRRLDTGEEIRLINVHLPGDPTKPGRFEFARYVNQTFDPTSTTLIMGDMNFNELEMADAMASAFSNRSPFSLYSPYPTNISPYIFQSKAIDHFFVYSPDASPVNVSGADQIMAELVPTVALLQGIGQLV